MAGPSRPSRGFACRPRNLQRTGPRVVKIQARGSFSKEKYGDPDEWRKLSLACRDRDGWQCKECGARFPRGSGKLHAAHIIARSKGGKNTLANLKSKCEGCHGNEHPHLKRLLQ